MARKQRINKRKQLERLLGQEIDVVLLSKGSNGKKSDEFNMKGILEKRNILHSNLGYYLQGTEIQIPLTSVKVNPRPYFFHRGISNPENVIVVQTKYSPEEINLFINNIQNDSA